MNRRTLAFALALVRVVALADEPTPEAVACYEWFGTLGFPDTANAAFARYTDGGWSSNGSGPAQPLRRGFVMEDAGGRFRILTPELEVKTLEKTKPDAPAHERVAWVETEFGDYLKTLLHELQNPAEDEDSLSRRFGERLSHPAEIFAIAYAAWRRGLPALSQDLFSEAVSKASVSSEEFRLRLEEDLGHAAMWRAIIAFGGGANWSREGPLVSRKDLLTLFESVIRHYPASEHIPRARETADMLKLMIAEDEVHARITDDELGRLPVADRVNELIFRLRDQNGHQSGQPGFCDIFDGRNTGSTAAHRLAEIGLDAVPALIAALSDKRFCRSVDFHRDFCFSHHVLTIGDCALAILQRIAGQGFYARRTTSSYMSGEEKEDSTRREVEVWWAEVQKKGFKQILVERLSSGKFDPRVSHAKLAALDAGATVPALLEGALKAKSEWLTSVFFDLLGSSSDPRATGFLLQRMREEASAASRVAAISALANSKREDVLSALLKEWHAYDPHAIDPDDRVTFESMVQLLARWRIPVSIDALGLAWETRITTQRMEICKEIAYAFAPDGRERESTDNPPAPPEAAAAAERILIRALDDNDLQESGHDRLGDWIFHNPAVPMIANWALHRIRPDTYACSKTASRHVRESERIAAVNTWRGMQGQPLLPAPVPRVKVSPQESLKIVEVLVHAPPDNAGKRLKDAAEALHSSGFTADTLPSLCRDFALKDTPGIAGMVVEAVRDDDLTGITITLRLTAGEYSGEGGSLESNITLGGEALLQSGGGATREYLGRPDAWDDELKSLRKLTAAPTGAAFTVRLAVGTNR